MPRITIRDWPPYSPTDQNRRENTIVAAKLMMNAALTAPNVGGLPMTEGEIVYGNRSRSRLRGKWRSLPMKGRHGNTYSCMRQ